MGEISEQSSPFASASWPLPAEADMVDLAFQRLADAAQKDTNINLDWAEQLGQRAMLASLFGNSPHLTEAALRNFGTVRQCWDDGPESAIDDILSTVVNSAGEERSTEKLMADLRIAKQRVGLAIALADISGTWPLESVTSTLSRLADTCLQTAISCLLRQADKRGDIDLSNPADPQTDCGYVVLAMGKLGARELNYSSDIDLIVLFNQEKVRSPRPERLPQTFQRITRDLVRIMEERTAEGYVFRTDLRLRPDPGSTPIALNCTTAELYYASLARTWERAAMIKARPCAGDIAEGHRFLSEISPFVWRVSLDFAVVEEISDMRARVATRAAKRTRQAGGYDVKLGPGGIRDIEFFVQTQQLTFGGREIPLRTPKTLDGLQALADSGRVGQPVADGLARAYRTWRTVEHRLQMVDDRQTHVMPTKPSDIDRIATFLGHDSRTSMEESLASTRGLVEQTVASYFGGSSSEAKLGMSFEGADPDPDTLEELRTLGFEEPERIFGLINGWMRGRARATRTDRGRQLLAQLAPSLVRRLTETGDPIATLARWDRFISGLPAGIQLFSLLAAHEELIGLLTELLSAAPIIADGLANRPDQLDALLLPDFLTQLPSADDLAADLATALSVSRHYEESLSIIRRWMNDQRLRTAVHLLRDPSNNTSCMAFLSRAVETALSTLLPLVARDFAATHGRIKGGGLAVIALGKLGSGEMDIGSDLDLILVFDAPKTDAKSDGEKPLNSGVYFARLTQRFITAMTAPMKVGTLFELDMRLRPSGNAGPLATSLESFTKYQSDDAWTWEHLALTRARVIAGPEELVERLQSEITSVLRRARDKEKTRTDILDMRARIAAQFGTEDVWDVKYARGGLMDIGFISQYFQLIHGADQPDLLHASTTEALRRLGQTGIAPADQVDRLIAGLTLCLRIQAYLRVTVGRQIEMDKAEPQVRRGLTRIVLGDGASLADFDVAEAQVRSVLADIFGLYRSIIGDDQVSEHKTSKK
ncbi:MAG: bifunctional [glutamine synthetase] adenylyltransferase/[glutamine synthetase]-adenylyl-L-tyrosine phosphorylase [Pseudomonadota bacterium]